MTGFSKTQRERRSRLEASPPLVGVRRSDTTKETVDKSIVVPDNPIQLSDYQAWTSQLKSPNDPPLPSWWQTWEVGATREQMRAVIQENLKRSGERMELRRRPWRASQAIHPLREREAPRR